MRERIKKVPTHVWILLVIISIGIFLRTYNLREWLYFYPDQARDAVIVEKVVNEGKSWPLMGAIAASTKFKIGPMYYYFQIITAKIFGTGPEKMAYPDIFFSILSIPLFYYFLSRFFNRNLSLGLTFLYTISFFMIEYSRFAWNPNPIPFFTLVFLIAVWKFLLYGNKVKWIWPIIIGIAVGVSVQLHTFLLLLFPATLGFVFLYFIKNKQWALSHWVAIILLVVALNIPQIISETQTNYANSRLFLKLFNSSSENGKAKFLENLKLDILDHSQANSHILSSLGDKLDFTYNSTLKLISKSNKTGKSASYPALMQIALSVAFFLIGCSMLAYYFKRKKEKEKKYFLGLIALFSALSFAIMFPIMDSLAIRYFIHMFFLPFFFLGLLLKFISEK
jgi:4-amino-4-deoxy-L-arabinose transferase-like glycosyltransferase